MAAAGLNPGIDLPVRSYIYRHFAEKGAPPTAARIAAHAGISPAEAAASLRRLHQGHFIFLQPDDPLSVRLANPFSAVPTGYRAQVDGRWRYANCAWDMLGIPAALDQDARVAAVYADGGETVSFTVAAGELVQPPPGVVHFPLPVRRWYDDLILT